LAGPQPFDNEATGGFNFEQEPGVIDIKSPGFCGYQQNFDKTQYGKGFGASGDELEGMILAGNTHDYSTRTAIDILQKHPECNISSTTPIQIAGLDLRKYRIANFTLGAQKDDGYSLTRRKAFTPEMLTAISQLTMQGTSIMVSGAFIGSDVRNAGDDAFIADKLKYRHIATTPTDSICTVEGLGNIGSIYSRPNEENYWLRSTDIIEGVGGAFNAMKYSTNNYPAAVAYPGPGYRVLAFGFPLECIKETETRQNIVGIAIDFLLGK
jgi:hypothetical protein